MTDQKETNQTNEGLNEELSTDDLKSVSGGWTGERVKKVGGYTDGGGQAENISPRHSMDPTGSGSGMTLDDYNKKGSGLAGTDNWLR